jgi:DNA-binding NarL/FixJ family response regulator
MGRGSWFNSSLPLEGGLTWVPSELTTPERKWIRWEYVPSNNRQKLCYNPIVNKTGKVRILIADDFKVLRDVIRLYLEQAGDMEVVDEAPDLNDALERARTLRPDVIIMNDYLPPIDSAHAAALFHTQGLPVYILVISMTVEPELIERSFQYGVDGFMHKDEIAEYLAEGVRSVMRGERYISPKATEAYDGHHP